MTRSGRGRNRGANRGTSKEIRHNKVWCGRNRGPSWRNRRPAEKTPRRTDLEKVLLREEQRASREDSKRMDHDKVLLREEQTPSREDSKKDRPQGLLREEQRG